MVWATGETSQAYARVSPGAEAELELLLGGGAPLTVRVVDRNGEALEGVPLGELFGEPGGKLEPTFKGRVTGVDGTSEFRDISTLLPPEAPSEIVQAATLAVPGLPTEPIWRPTGAEPPRTVEIELGPTGGFDLEVVDEDGKPLATLGLVTLDAVGDEDFGPQLTLVVAGRAHFEYVGLGAAFDVRLRVESRGLDESITIRGPVRRGETATATFVVPTRPVLRGTVVDMEGELVADEPLRLELFSKDIGRPKMVELRTDAAGRFEARVPESIALGVEVGGELLLETRSGTGRYGARADVARPFVVHAGFEELGRLVLRPIVGALRGHCVDMNGKPIEGLKITTVQPRFRTSWATETDAKGAFTLRGTWYEAPMLSFRGSEGWVLKKGQRFDLQDPDNEVVCLQGGRLRESVLSGSDADLAHLSISVWEESRNVTEGIGYAALGRPDSASGSFDLGGLEGGIYTLVVRSANSIAAELHGLRVVPGEVSELPPIDLAAMMMTLEFDVLGPNGDPVYRPHASVFVDGKMAAYANGEGGRVSLTGAMPEGALLLVTNQGLAPKVLEVEAVPDTVVLERAIQLHLYTHGRPALQDGRRSAALQLSRSAGDARLGDARFSGSIPGSLAEEGRASVFLPGPGTYRLEVSTSEAMGGGMMSAGTAEPLPGDFLLEIRAEDAGKSFEVILPENLFE